MREIFMIVKFNLILILMFYIFNIDSDIVWIVMFDINLPTPSFWTWTFYCFCAAA